MAKEALARAQGRGGAVALPQTVRDGLLAGLLSENTKRAYGTDLSHFADWLRESAGLDIGRDERALAEVTKDHVVAYREALRDAGKATTTVNRRLSVVRRLLAEAQERGLVAHNAAAKVAGLRTNGDYSPTQGLTREQALALLEVCKGEGLREWRDRALLGLMLRTGLRRSEVVNLRVGDLGQRDGHRALRVQGKGGVTRQVKLTPKGWRELKTWLDQAGIVKGDEYLFRPLRRVQGGIHGVNGNRPLTAEAVRFIVEQRCRQAGIEGKVSPHSMRHTFITLALQGGAPLHKVQYAAGHADPRTTERYDRRREDLDDNAADYLRL